MIVVRDVHKRFGSHTVLASVNLTITRGERVALLGFNGSGKTTLFRCVLGVTPFAGTISIDDIDVTRRGEHARRHVTYVPQRAPRFEGTLRQTIHFFCALRGISPGGVHRRLEQAGVAIEHHGDKPISALSGGMLQKVLLALTMTSASDLFVLDEPTANLDTEARQDFLSSVASLPEHATVLLSSHRIGDIRAVARRAVILNQGHVAFDGPLSELSQYRDLPVDTPTLDDVLAGALSQRDAYGTGPLPGRGVP